MPFLSRLAAVAILAFALPAFAAEPKADDVPTITLPLTLRGDVGEMLKVTATTDGANVEFVPLSQGLGILPAGELKDARSTYVSATAAGDYTLLAYTARGDVPSRPARVVIHFGPVGPGPDPPPGPTPPVDPDVPSATGLHVLVIYKKDAAPKWLFDQDFLALLDAKCAKDGSTPGYRVWTPEVAARAGEDLPLWKKAAAVKRTADSWIVIMTDKGGASRELPATKAEAMDLVKKYGGQ